MLRKLKNNKGSILFTRVICYMILIVVFIFGVDLVLFFVENIAVSYQTAYIAEKVGIQGGLVERNIYPGTINSQKTNITPLTNKELSDMFIQSVTWCGIKSENISIYFIDENGIRYTIYENGKVKKFDDRAADESLVTEASPGRLPYMATGNVLIVANYYPLFALGWGNNPLVISKDVPVVGEYVLR